MIERGFNMTHRQTLTCTASSAICFFFAAGLASGYFSGGLTNPAGIITLKIRAPAEHVLSGVTAHGEKIALAKRLMGLPTTVPPDTLWRTYMTRLHGVPFDATIQQMMDGQVRRDMRFNLLCEGLPEWCPHAYTMINIKQNFEHNFLAPIAARRVYGLPPFASVEEYEARAAKKKQEFDRQVQSTKLDFMDWYAHQIKLGFGLPSNTSNADAWKAFNRSTLILGGPCTPQELAKVQREIQRSDDLLVLSPTKKMTDEELERCRLVVLEGIKLESPNLPTRFYLFY